MYLDKEMIMSTIEGHMCRCDCGNLYYPSGKPICYNCNLVKKLDKFYRLAVAIEERRAIKRAKRLKKKNV